MQGRRWWLTAGLVAALAAYAVEPARADDMKSILERLERLEKENQELKAKLDAKFGPGADNAPYSKELSKQQQDALKKDVDNYLKDKDDKKKAADAKTAKEKEDAGFEVGKHLDVKGQWRNSQLWFETEDKAFRLHVGGRTQIDAVWATAPQAMQAQPGATSAGVGNVDDAFSFRRARLAVEGTFWEVFDFNCEYDFANTARIVPNGNVLATPVGGSQALAANAFSVGDRQNIINTPVPTDLWITWTKLPVVGNVRVGNQKPWISYEHLTSSRWLDFMERSSAFDAFVENGNNGFQPGISAFNNYFGDRMIVAGGVYKPNFRDIYGWDVGDGEYQFVGRVAGTPIFEENGRCMLHLGLGYLHSTADDGVVRFRARSQLRNGPPLLHNIYAIVQAQAHNYDLINPEVAFNYGPFNMSGEYYYAEARQRPGEVFQNLGNQTANLPPGGRGTLTFQGAYLTAGYFLTGEHRSYNRKVMSWDRQAVDEPAFAVDGDGGTLIGRGAVEILARYSWLDLSSKGVNGGVLNTGTFGINWYLNPNAKIQANYEIGYRDATQYATVGGVPGVVTGVGAGLRDGVYQGFGTRFAFDF